MYPNIGKVYDCPWFLEHHIQFGRDAAAGWKMGFELVHGKETYDPWFEGLTPDDEAPWVTLREICRELIDRTARAKEVLPFPFGHPIECAMTLLDTYASLSRFSDDWARNADHRTVEQFVEKELPAICDTAFGAMPYMLWHGLRAANDLCNPDTSFERYLGQQRGNLDLDDMDSICERALASEDYALKRLPQYTEHSLALMHQACQALLTLQPTPEMSNEWDEAIHSGAVFRRAERAWA